MLVDLWHYCGGVCVNACLNMSWIMRNEHGGALSLAAMVNRSRQVESVFVKDKATTTSSWGAPQLSIRQILYAALDAQVSWAVGSNQTQIPRPFHAADLPQAWMQRAAVWKQMARAH